MNIFLLGNGFDLHYLLPTGYPDFLNTIDYLCKHQSDPIMTVGDVFRELSKDKNNKIIRGSYEKYGKCYDSMELPNDELTELVSTAEKNKWFQYFIKCKIKGNGWIDFEKEIKRVLSLLDTIFYFAICGADQHKKQVPIENQSDISLILDVFHLGFFDFSEYPDPANKNSNSVIVPENAENKDSFSFMKRFYRLVFESNSIFDSRKIEFFFRPDLHNTNTDIPQLTTLNKNAIVDELLSSLQEFSRILTTYLKLFIERPLKMFVEEGVVDLDVIFKSEAVVVSLNYTNTFEALYYDPNTARKTIIHNGVALPGICHIHGKTNSSIVLGIDSDDKDELNELDTRFLSFKKYYQRVIYKTDNDYLSLLQKTSKEQNKEYDLFVFGHSLDVTDRDIIIELFDLAKTISIFYHSQNELEKYVRRLVSIYGKKDFDSIRVSKELTFFHTDELNFNWRILCQ